MEGCQLVIAAGAAGATLLPRSAWQDVKGLEVLVDLNAVPPSGIEGVNVMDRGTRRDTVICYGALGVGGTKMKIHKAAIRRLFEASDQVFDAEELLAIGRQMGSE
jgi:hypothetical protein